MAESAKILSCSEHVGEYDRHSGPAFNMIWGDGFLSPGGAR